MGTKEYKQTGFQKSSKHDFPLVSVCIPTFQDAACLSQCLNSIIAQSYKNIEILVGDDASNDGTEEIVRSIDDDRLRYFRNTENLGQFENVNQLVTRAKGKYIAIYHSDDFYDPEIVGKEVAFLENHPNVGAVFALDWRVDDEGRITGRMRLLPDIRARSGLSFLDVLPILLRNRNRLFRTPTFLGRADVLREAGRFRSAFDIAGDLEMWLRITLNSQIAILDEYLMYYRRGSSQVSARYEWQRTGEDSFFSIMDMYLSKVPEGANIDPSVMLEYEYHRRADETLRAINCVRLGRLEEARNLLNRPFPWQTFLVFTSDLHLRKTAVVLKRIFLKLFLFSGIGQMPRWLLDSLSGAVSHKRPV